jgi:lysozyme
MITSLSEQGIKLAQYFECGGDPDNPKWLKAYLDSGGVWTIGIGTIQYPNGAKVKKGDTITREQMYDYFRFEMRVKVERVIVLTRDDINQDQFDALVDFAYNVGTNALQKSTLLKTLNNKPADMQIVDNFFSWRFDNGKEIGGLLRRRMSEALLYFTGRLKFDWVNYKKLSAATRAEVLKEINRAV